MVRSRSVRRTFFGLIQQANTPSRWRPYCRSLSDLILLENQTVLAHPIKRRNPYVDPLNYLQIRFLARWRKANETRRTETLRWFRPLALTVHGIASGMKSTG